MGLRNIFLDFFNRDSREIYGLFNHLSTEQHIRFLVGASNVAAFLCSDWCFMPPGFVGECSIARRAIKRRESYLTERLFRLPIRDRSLDDFFAKKEQEYRGFKRRYSGLWELETHRFLERHASALVERRAKVGAEIVKGWEEAPECHPLWARFRDEIDTRGIESIRNTPRLLQEQGVATTWEAMSKLARKLLQGDHIRLRELLQHVYFSVYLREFELRLVTGLPHARADFGFGRPDLCYDYEALRAALKPISIWELVVTLSAELMIALRFRPGYVLFRDVFDDVARRCTTPADIRRRYALSVQLADTSLVDPRVPLIPVSKKPAPAEGLVLTDSQLDALDYRLWVAADAVSREFGHGPSWKRMPSRIRVLFVMAHPTDLPRLEVDVEIRAVTEAIKRSPHKELVQIRTLHAATTDDLRRALLEEEFDVLHFSGHGGKKGTFFSDSENVASFTPLEAIGQLVKRYPAIKCVVLNACWTLSEQAEPLADYTIGMTGPVGDRAAIEFARGFYDALAAGKGFEFAVREGETAVDLKGLKSELPLIFLKRQGGEAST